MGRLAAHADEGLERINAETKTGTLRQERPGFLLFQALHTGRTYLKNRAQSW